MEKVTYGNREERSSRERRIQSGFSGASAVAGPGSSLRSDPGSSPRIRVTILAQGGECVR